MSLLPRATSIPDCRRVACCVGLAFLLIAAGVAGAVAQTGEKTPPAQTTTDEIVRRLVENNQERAARLRFYSSERYYHLVYSGFPHHAEASMDAEMTCSGPTSKSFRVLSQSGSHFLVDHVLKRLLISEQKAARMESKNALTPANYRFRLIGRSVQEGRLVYELRVDPRVASKYLYRGEIWVDAKDYAVTQIEAEPATRLSFWIRKVDIHHVYHKTGLFWLPYRDKSETRVTLGGTADLTIDYGTYSFTPRPIQTSLPSELRHFRTAKGLPNSDLALRQ
jgi:hypothetical protein